MQQDVIQHFEKSFRDYYSSLDIQFLLDGSVPKTKISTLIISSLEGTAQYCLDQYEHNPDSPYRDLSNMLWNPLTAALMKEIVSSKSDAEKALPPKPLKQTKVKAVPSPIAISDNDVSNIRTKLKEVSLKRTHLFKTPGHQHVKCDEASCEFCKHVFNNLNITKCEGHKRCSIVGWYPHVGVSLWQMLRKKHASKVTPTLQQKPCRPHEIKALAVEDINMDISNFDESEEEEPSIVGSKASTPSNSPWQSPAKRSWADESLDVEELYLKKRAANTSDVSTSSRA